MLGARRGTGWKCNTIAHLFHLRRLVSDQDGIQELLDNIPEIAQEFDVLSKIGEGMSDSSLCVCVCV